MRSLRICCALLLSLPLALSEEAGGVWPDAVLAGPAQDGAWTDTTTTACTAIHVAVLRAPGDSTQVLYWGDERDFVSGAFQTTSRVWRFEPGAGFSLSNCFSAPVRPEPFCGGHTTMSDGRLFIPGGQFNLYTGRDDSHIYSPATRKWDWQPNMGEARWYPTATALPDGNILVTAGEKYATLEIFGGANGSDLPDTLLQYSILDTASWLRVLPVVRPSPRKNHTLTWDRDRSVSVLYGGEGSGGALSDVWACVRTDESTGPDDHTFTWVQVTQNPDPVAGLPAARSLHTTVFAQGLGTSGGAMLVHGGQGANGEPLGDTWLLEVEPQGASFVADWTRLEFEGSAPLPRYGHSAVVHDALGRVFVFGGCLGETFSDSLWMLDLNTMAWTGSRSNVGPKARYRHAALLSGEPASVSRTLMITGGADADSCMATTWSANVSVVLPLVWTQRRNLPTPRRGLTLTFDPFGPVIATGGESFAGVANNEVSVIFLGSFAGWFPIPQTTRIAPRAGHAVLYNPKFVHARVPEIFTPSPTGPGSWTQLHDAALLLPMYPLMFVAPNGKVFMAGPGITTRYLDLGSETWEPPIFAHSAAGSAAMYAPGKILRAGAHEGMGTPNNAEFIDLNSPSPAWVHTSGMTPRDFMNLTLLPTGEVLVTGGSLGGIPDRRPQRWKPGVGWGPPLAPEAVIRGYHSTAALLPDGRILSAGGSSEFGGGPADIAKRTASIYSPPYLFDASGLPAARPLVPGAPAAVSYGQVFTLCASPSPPGAVVLMRPAAVTHAFNQSQLRIPMTFTTASDPPRLLVTAPSSPIVAPPGDYMLFVVGQDSVPSLARWVRLSDTPGADSCDQVAPGPVAGLTVKGFCTRVELSWTAPADDRSLAASGSARQYELRWFPRASIGDPDTFAIANPLATTAPLAPGATETFVDPVGACSGPRFYALRAVDDAPTPHAGAISVPPNFVSTPCTPPECDDDNLSVGDRPLRLGLIGPSPNPVRDRLQVALLFSAEFVGQHYRLALFDLAGRRTNLLDSGPIGAAGRIERAFPLRASGTVRPGLYFLRLSVAGREIQKRVAVIP